MLIISRGDQVPCQYDKSSDNNIFYGKKVQEIKKKNGYAAATKVLCLYMHFFTFIGGNCPLSLYIVFHIYFTTTSRIMLRF